MIRTKNVTGINVEHKSSAPSVKASTDGVYGENDNQDNIGAGEGCLSTFLISKHGDKPLTNYNAPGGIQNTHFLISFKLTIGVTFRYETHNCTNVHNTILSLSIHCIHVYM